MRAPNNSFYISSESIEQLFAMHKYNLESVLQRYVGNGDWRMVEQILESDQYKSNSAKGNIILDNYLLFHHLVVSGNIRRIENVLKACRAAGLLKAQLLCRDYNFLCSAADSVYAYVLKRIISIYKQENLFYLSLCTNDHSPLKLASYSSVPEMIDLILNEYKNAGIIETALLFSVKKRSYLASMILNKYKDDGIVTNTVRKVLSSDNVLDLRLLIKYYKYSGSVLKNIDLSKHPLSNIGDDLAEMIADLYNPISSSQMLVSLYTLYSYLITVPYKLHYCGGEKANFGGQEKKVPRNIRLALFEYEEMIDEVSTLPELERLKMIC